MARMNGLEGKRVLVTGGASGIGAATALRFLVEGACVTILDRDPDTAAALCTGCPDLMPPVIADVRDRGQVAAAIDDAARAMGGLDILINNAGISVRHGFLDITPEEWDRVVGVNLTGAFHVAQLGAIKMLAEHATADHATSTSPASTKVILNTASTNGIMGYPQYADYNAAKAGLIELTRSMALELAPQIRVNAVAPGYVLTPMQRSEYTDEMLAEVNRKLPLGRHAEPEEVAGLFAFLASSDAAYMTGHVYPIDGGEIAGGLASR